MIGGDFIDLLAERRTRIVDEVRSRRQLLSLLVSTYRDDLGHTSPAEIFKKLFEREQLSSTTCGQGVAMPHCRLNSIEFPLAAALFVRGGASFLRPPDKLPVHLFLSSLTPSFMHPEHLRCILSEAFVTVVENSVVDIMNASSDRSLYAFLCTIWPKHKMPANASIHSRENLPTLSFNDSA